MYQDMSVSKSRFRRPELEKVGCNVELLKKFRSLNNYMRELNLDACAVKMFVGKREIEQ